MTKLPYREGDWFAVPLGGGDHATGVIARLHRRGRLLIGYFFGPRLQRLPTPEELDRHHPESAVLVARFGDLYLIEGKWPNLGRTEGWKRERWPMPTFCRFVEVDGTAWRVHYSDDDELAVQREDRISIEACRKLPEDSAFGAGAIEATLNQRLAPAKAARSRWS